MTAAPIPVTWPMVEAAAETLGAAPDRRRKWRNRGRQVPAEWRIRIAEHLAAAGTPIELSSFDDLPPRPGKLSRERVNA